MANKLKRKYRDLKTYCYALQTAYTNAMFDIEELKKNLKPAIPTMAGAQSIFYDKNSGKPKKIAVINMEAGSKLLNALNELIAEFGSATVADLHDMLGYTTTVEDNKYGWLKLDGWAQIESGSDGTFVVLPEPELLDERKVVNKLKPIARYKFDVYSRFILETRKHADELRNYITLLIKERRHAGVHEVLEWLGQISDPKDGGFGWKQDAIENMHVEFDKNQGYILIMPDPVLLIVQEFVLETKKAAEHMRDYLIDAIQRNGAVSVHEALNWLDRPANESDYNVGWTIFDEFQIHYTKGIGYILSLPEPIKLNSGTQERKLSDDARIRQASSDYDKAQLEYIRAREPGFFDNSEPAKMKAKAAFDFLLHTIEEVSKERNVKNV